MIAWTTTPWTLPSNLALCVNPDKDYVKVREKESGAIYILMEARICELYKDPEAYEVCKVLLRHLRETVSVYWSVNRVVS